MIERHVTFHVHPDQGPDFETFFITQYRPAMSTMRGFQRVELLRETDEPNRYEMVIRFDSAEAAAEWRNSSAHQALQPRFKALYSESKLQVYDVIA